MIQPEEKTKKWIHDHVDTSCFTPSARIYCKEDSAGIWAGIDYEYDQALKTPVSNVIIYAHPVEEGPLTDAKWREALSIAMYLQQTYHLPLVIQ